MLRGMAKARRKPYRAKPLRKNAHIHSSIWKNPKRHVNQQRSLVEKSNWALHSTCRNRRTTDRRK